MSITFACGQCGKTFTLDDRFAGKKGQCKGCGAVMQIPGLSPQAATSAVKAKPAAMAARSAPKPEPVHDAYGFDDLPDPGKYHQGSLYDDDEAFNSIPPRIGEVAPKPRKSVARKKKSPSMGLDFSGGGRQLVTMIVVGLFLLGGLGGVVTALRHQGVELPDWIPNSQVETMVKERLALFESLNVLLKPVVDVGTAGAASVQANELIRKLTQNLRKLKVVKDTKAEINYLKEKYVNKIEQVGGQVRNEVNRIAAIPGAVEALNVFAAAQELENEEEEVKRILQTENGGVPSPMTPPQFMPPRQQNFGQPQGPRFNPPQLPNINPPQGPNFTPPRPPSVNPQPGNMNRFGPNRGRPNIPGPRFGRPGN